MQKGSILLLATALGIATVALAQPGPDGLTQEERALKSQFKPGTSDHNTIVDMVRTAVASPCPKIEGQYRVIGERTTGQQEFKFPGLASKFPLPFNVSGKEGQVEYKGLEYQWSETREYEVPIKKGDTPFSVSGALQGQAPCGSGIDLLPAPTIPSEWAEPKSDANAQAEEKMLNKLVQASSTPLVAPHDAPETAPLPRDRPGFKLDCQQYLCGRDIILVHGLDLKVLPHPMLKVAGVWRGRNDPSSAAFLPGGFWYQRSEAAWGMHLAAIGAKGAKNRYIHAPWAITDRAEGNVKAITNTIALAMKEGTGVLAIGGVSPRKDGFCVPSCVIVSSSTGALLADIFLGTGELSKSVPKLKSLYGEISNITERIKAHIAYQGAFGGSDFATILGYALEEFGHSASSSIAVDLTPSVARKWHPVMGANKSTPVLLVNSASPDGAYQLDLFQNADPKLQAAWKAVLGPKNLSWLISQLHPGPDDSVLAMSSACANSVDSQQRPPGFVAPLLDLPEVFDRGMSDDARALRFLWSQLANKNGGGLSSPNYVASMCNNILTSWGMVLPAPKSVPSSLNVKNRLGSGLGSHCPVIISTKRHGLEASAENDQANREETYLVPPECLFLHQKASNVVNRYGWDADDGRFLDPAVSSQIVHTVRDRVVGPVYIKFCICFKIFGKKVEIRVNLLVFPEIVIWRRHYYRMKDWESKNVADSYAMDYFLR